MEGLLSTGPTPSSLDNSTSSSMDQIENFSDQSRTFNSNGELVGAKMVGLDENIGV